MTKTKRGFMDGYKTYDTTKGFGSVKDWQKEFYSTMTDTEALRILQEDKRTPYEILNVSPMASPEQIKKAFKAAIMQWHPDRNQNNIAQAEEMSKKIIAAYTILKSGK